MIQNISLTICFTFVTVIGFAQINVETVGTLPDEVFETSGLVFYNNHIITHNDSGNATQLFELDTLSLEITRTVSITNAVNVDWEDIAQDETYFYIGDFGNFNGDRTDLSIYRISKALYDTSDTVAAERISFVYDDQTNFISNPRSDLDAEAMIVLEDRLVILTKQWQTQGTVAYALPKTIGDHSALPIENTFINGLVTGASYNAETQILMLVGYSQQLIPFIIRFNDTNSTTIFNGTGERTDPPLGITQVEGITCSSTERYFFSSERFLNENPPVDSTSRLFTFTINTQDEDEDTDGELPTDPDNIAEEQLIIYRDINSNLLNYDFNTDETIIGRAIFDVTGKLIGFVLGTDIKDNAIDISNLSGSVYYLTFYLSDGIVSKGFILD